MWIVHQRALQEFISMGMTCTCWSSIPTLWPTVIPSRPQETTYSRKVTSVGSTPHNSRRVRSTTCACRCWERTRIKCNCWFIVLFYTQSFKLIVFIMTSHPGRLALRLSWPIQIRVLSLALAVNCSDSDHIHQTIVIITTISTHLILHHNKSGVTHRNIYTYMCVFMHMKYTTGLGNIHPSIHTINSPLYSSRPHSCPHL